MFKSFASIGRRDSSLLPRVLDNDQEEKQSIEVKPTRE